jgi:hypothetical protein
MTGMKFAFKITTNPTLHADVTIVIISLAFTALALIAIVIGNPTLGLHCAMVLAFILWFFLIIQPPIVPEQATLPPAKTK